MTQLSTGAAAPFGAPDDVYAEFRSPVSGVRCAWQRQASRGARPLIVPDGCVDLVWFTDGRFEIAGPDTSGRRVPVSTDLEIVGVRLAPAAARRVIGMPIGELCDQQPAMHSVDRAWQRNARSLTELDGAALPDRREALVASAARAVGRPVDAMVKAAVRRLARRQTNP